MRIAGKVLCIIAAALLIMGIVMDAAGYGIPGYQSLYSYVHGIRKKDEPFRLEKGKTVVDAKDNGYGTQPYAENVLVNDSGKKYLILRVSFDAYGSPDYKTGSCSQTIVNVKPHSRTKIMALCTGGGITTNKDVTLIENPRIYGY